MDVSGGLYAASFHVRITQILRRALKLAWRWLIQFSRPLHRQSLVRTFLVKNAPPLIKAGLLFLTTKLPLVIQMQAFVSTIVLWAARSSPFQIDAQSHPPGRELAQSQHASAAGEGHPVVAANGFGHALALKEPLKTCPHRLAASIGHSSHVQHVAGAFVPYRQRLTALAIGSVPPAFEIDRPNLIGGTGFAARADPPGLRAMPHAPLLHQASSLQDALETALAGHLAVDSLVDVPQLARTPAPVCVFESDDLADHRLSKLFGMAQRTAGELTHALISILVKALPPLVASLGADPV